MWPCTMAIAPCVAASTKSEITRALARAFCSLSGKEPTGSSWTLAHSSFQSRRAPRSSMPYAQSSASSARRGSSVWRCGARDWGARAMVNAKAQSHWTGQAPFRKARWRRQQRQRLPRTSRRTECANSRPPGARERRPDGTRGTATSPYIAPMPPTLVLLPEPSPEAGLLGGSGGCSCSGLLRGLQEQRGMGRAELLTQAMKQRPQGPRMQRGCCGERVEQAGHRLSGSQRSPPASP